MRNVSCPCCAGLLRLPNLEVAVRSHPSPRRAGLLGLGAAALLAFGAVNWVTASDHKDGPVTGAHPPIDIADLYAFRSPTSPDNLVLVMDVRGFISPAEAG